MVVVVASVSFGVGISGGLHLSRGVAVLAGIIVGVDLGDGENGE